MKSIIDYSMNDIKFTLYDFITLWLKGGDDKIYIDVYDRHEDIIIEDVRIISERLNAFYEYNILYFVDYGKLVGIVLDV